MRIKRFNEGISIYQVDLKRMMPNQLTINQSGKEVTYKIGEITKNFDMIQCPYVNEEIWGFAETLELDLYIDNNENDNEIKLSVDITLGDAMVSEFSLEAPNKVSIIQYTSYHSKTDQSNTVFAFTDNSLQDLIDFFNEFQGFRFSTSDFKFLDMRDDYTPN